MKAFIYFNFCNIINFATLTIFINFATFSMLENF